MARAFQKFLFSDFEASPWPSWWARLPVTSNFFHSSNDLSNRHGIWLKAFSEGPKLALLVTQHAKVGHVQTIID